MANHPFYIHPTAEVSPGAHIGAHVHVGSRVKIQNYALIYEGVTLEDGVFVGPGVCFTNDLLPRAITPDGKLKDARDWEVTPTLVKYGASIGAGAVILCGVAIGTFALVGAGSLVTRDVAPHALVFGNPARQHGYVCRCARRLADVHEQGGGLVGWCEICGQVYLS